MPHKPVFYGKKEESILKESLVKIDSSLAYISFRFIKKFDHFLTVLLNNHTRLLNSIIDKYVIYNLVMIKMIFQNKHIGEYVYYL